MKHLKHCETSWNTLHSMWRYRSSMRRRRRSCGVSGDIGDCGVGITPQMCKRVTNHGDMSTFSKPAQGAGRMGEPSKFLSWKCNYSIYLDIQVYYMDTQAISTLLCLLLVLDMYYVIINFSIIHVIKNVTPEKWCFLSPVWKFHFMIKCTSLTYLHDEWPISHCTENIWICVLSNQSPRRSKRMQFKRNFLCTLWTIVEETLTSNKYISMFLISILNMYIWNFNIYVPIRVIFK